jgi:hypothetical protein
LLGQTVLQAQLDQREDQVVPLALLALLARVDLLVRAVRLVINLLR